jgi:hypothetical protein
VSHPVPSRPADEREREREREIRRDPAGSEGGGKRVINEAPGAARAYRSDEIGGPIKPLIGLARFLPRASESPQDARS